MPFFPELRHRERDVRRIEILHQLYSEYLGRPHRYDGISPEIAINLDREQDRRHDQVPPAVRRVILVDSVDKQCDPVGQDDLQKISPDHEQDAFPEVVKVKLLGDRQLPDQVLGPFDRSGHKLREERHEQRVLQKILLRVDLIPVHVHGVAQRLESIERYSDRQQNIKGRHLHTDMKDSEQAFQRPEREIYILEIEKDPQIQDETAGYSGFQVFLLPPLIQVRSFHLLDDQAADVRDDRGSQYEHRVLGVPAHVKVVARRQQPDVFYSLRYDKIYRHDNRKKRQKVYGIK